MADLYHDSNMKFKNDYSLNKRLRRENRFAALGNILAIYWLTRSPSHSNFCLITARIAVDPRAEVLISRLSSHAEGEG